MSDVLFSVYSVIYICNLSMQRVNWIINYSKCDYGDSTITTIIATTSTTSANNNNIIIIIITIIM
jgi:hypothetical protein